jgi:hypothetical protein
MRAMMTQGVDSTIQSGPDAEALIRNAIKVGG